MIPNIINVVLATETIQAGSQLPFENDLDFCEVKDEHLEEK